MVTAGRVRGGSFQRNAAARRRLIEEAPDGNSVDDVFNQYERQEWARNQSDALNESFTQDQITPYWLEPIGESGFYITPNEPVDPQDCDRYPDSPWCGGSGVDPIDLATFSPVSASVTFTANSDLTEFCLRVDSALFGVHLAPTHACYRTPNARPFDPRPDPPPSDAYPPDSGDPPPEWFPFDFEYQEGACVYIVYMTSEHMAWFWAGTTNDTSQSAMGRPTGGYWVGTIEGGSRYRIHVPGISATGLYAPGGTDYFTVENPTADRSNKPYVVDIRPHYNLAGSCPPLPPRDTVPPPPPNPDEPMPCCNTGEIEEMLRKIMLRLGTDQYPATVPQNLADKEATTEKIENLTDLLGWTVRQMDALMGQFPLEIEIKDVDPSQQGDQTRKVTLPNMAEYASEMYGLALRSAVNSDIHTNFLMRLAAELIATKNAAIITQDYARANASYLGYKANTVKRQVDYAFNVTDLDNLEKVLNNSQKQIIGWQDDDENTVQAYFEKLMFAAGIIKQVYFKPNSVVDELSKQLQNLLGVNSTDKAEDDQKVEEAWKAFLQEINSPAGGFNRNSFTVPRVSDPTVSGEAGQDVTPTGFDLISDVDNPDPATG